MDKDKISEMDSLLDEINKDAPNEVFDSLLDKLKDLFQEAQKEGNEHKLIGEIIKLITNQMNTPEE